MPSLRHLDSKNTLNAMLNMALRGRGVLGHPGQGLLSNLTRLTDKAVIEYEAARAALDRYVDPAGNRPLSELFRTFDHLETCLDAVHRAGRHAEALRTVPSTPNINLSQLPSRKARERVRVVRNAIQHAEGDLLKGKTGFGTGRPVGLIATSTTLVAGEKALYIRYNWLAAWITLYHDLVRDLIDR
jgi:hypothetical protein